MSLAKPLHVGQIQETEAESPGSIVVSQANEPLRDLFILGNGLGLKPITGLTDPEHLAGQPNRYAALLNHPFGFFAAPRWPHHLFFERLRHDLRLELHLNLHPTQSPVLLLQLLHLGHHRGVYPL